MYNNSINARNEIATRIIDEIRHHIKALNNNFKLLESLHCNAFTDAMDENLIIKLQVCEYGENCPGGIENTPKPNYGYSQSLPFSPRIGHKTIQRHYCPPRYNRYQKPGKIDEMYTSLQISVIDQGTMSQVDVIVQHHNHNHNQSKHPAYPYR